MGGRGLGYPAAPAASPQMSPAPFPSASAPTELHGGTPSTPARPQGHSISRGTAKGGYGLSVPLTASLPHVTDRLQIWGAGSLSARIRAVCSGIRARFSHSRVQEPRSALLSSAGLMLCFKGLGQLGVLWGMLQDAGLLTGATQQTSTEPNGLGPSDGWERSGDAPNSWSHL